MLPIVVIRTRDFELADLDDLVSLSLRAWEPVFASMARVLGAVIDSRLHGQDWKTYQENSVRTTFSTPGMKSWVAESDGRLVGYVAAIVRDDERRIGEIEMLAVDPADQGTGTGLLLTEVATEWLRSRGVLVAIIDTGGDVGHEPARRTYEKAGYTLMPIARYFKAL